MGFMDLNEEQREILNVAKDFVEKEVWPKTRHYDESCEFPMEEVRKAHELGFVNAWVPESVGGSGMGVLANCLIGEAFGWAGGGFGTAVCANELAAAPLLLVDDPKVNEKFLAPMVDEPQMASYCVTEPGAGSDVASLRTTAVKKGDKYVLNGQKMWITNAAHASWFFVLAKTDPKAGHKGMTGFAVPAELPGVSVGKKEDNMGQRCSDTRAVNFDNVAVPAEYVLGQEGGGFKLAMGAFDITRPIVAAGAVGLAQRALDCAVQYAKERSAFGSPIAQHQAVAFMIADMARDIEAGRLLTWKSAAMRDAGERNSYMASIAKLFTADSAMRITTDAVQVYGGYGYNKEFPVEMLMRDAKIFQIYEGTSQIQRLIISRHLLGT